MGQGKGKSYYFDHAAINYINEYNQLLEFKMDGKEEIHINGIRRIDIEELNDRDYLDFKFSFDNIQFETETEKIETLKDISKKILQIKTEYKSKNRVRKNDLTGAIISIHTEKKRENVTINNKNIFLEVHLHLVIPRKKLSNFGVGYKILKKEIINIISNSGLTSSLNTEIIQKDKRNYKIVKDRLTAFSWTLEKHNAEQLQKYFSKKENHKLSINFENINDILQEYINMGGSVAFVRKIGINLLRKMNFKIDCKLNENYIEIKKALEEDKYEDIIKNMVKMVKNGQKVPEILKLHKFSESQRDIEMKKIIRQLYRHRGYRIDENNDKIIDIEVLEAISEAGLAKLKEIDYDKNKDEVYKFLMNSKAKNEQEIFEESNGLMRVNKRGEIIYKNLIFRFK